MNTHKYMAAWNISFLLYLLWGAFILSDTGIFLASCFTYCMFLLLCTRAANRLDKEAENHQYITMTEMESYIKSHRKDVIRITIPMIILSVLDLAFPTGFFFAIFRLYFGFSAFYFSLLSSFIASMYLACLLNRRHMH